MKPLEVYRLPGRWMIWFPRFEAVQKCSCYADLIPYHKGPAINALVVTIIKPIIKNFKLPASAMPLGLFLLVF